MKNSEKDALDLLFEHKNRAYGAFALRRNYATNMRNSIFLTFGAVFLMFLWPVLRPKNIEWRKKEIPDFVPGAPPEIEKKETPPPPELRTLQPIAARPIIQFLPPKIVRASEAEATDLADLDEPNLQEIGPKNTNGGMNLNEIEVVVCNFRDETEKFKPEIGEEAVLIFVEIMPQFPLGEAEMLKFLIQHIKIPPLAMESGIQGRVFVSFIVEKTGELTDLKIVKDPGGGCAKEVIRVVRLMPNWRPGLQNGQPVRVRMNLPVAIHLE